MLAPFGVLREPHVGSRRQPVPGQRVGVLDEQVGRRPAVGSRIEVSFHTEMNLRAIKGDEAVSTALPLAGAKSKPAVVGKGGIQVANREDGRYSRTHDYNLCRPERCRAGRQGPRVVHDRKTSHFPPTTTARSVPASHSRAQIWLGM
jgi:hypothetical protein